MKLRLEKLDKQSLLKAAVIVLIVVVVQAVVAFAVVQTTINSCYTAAFQMYSQVSGSAAQSFTETEESWQYENVLEFSSGYVVTIDGKNYTLRQSLIDSLGDDYYICNASELFSSESPYEGTLICRKNQSMLSVSYVSSILAAISGDYDGLAITGATGGVLYSQGVISGKLSDYSSTFSTSVLDGAVDVVSVSEGSYAVAVTSVGDYFIAAYTDFSAQQSNINSLIAKVIVAVAVVCVLTVAAVAFMALMFVPVEKPTCNSYRFVVDSYGRITSSDKKFEKDFPSVVVVPDDVSSYDENCYNAIKLSGRDGDKLLACTVHKRSARYEITAGELNLSQYAGSKPNVMQDVFEAFCGNGKRVLIGSICYSNLEMIGAMFGKRFAEKVRDVITGKCREKFTYIYLLDSARLGVLFPEGKELDRLLSDMSDIVGYLNQPVRVDNNLVNVEVKCGFAICDAVMKNLNFEYANIAADAALKRAQESGDSNYYVYHESQKKLYSKYFLSFDIAKMLQDGAFEMEFQPQYSLNENRIVGFESLFRVKKSAALNASTYDVITYAERAGYMIPLGDFIFDTSMSFAKEVEDMGVTVSLNVSPVQFMQAGFVDNFLRLYTRHNIKDGVICIEITESFLMTTFDLTLQKMNILRSHGIEFHLDDFGTRYSSLLYLKKLPISAIKIDMEFVRDMCENNYSRAITGMIISVSNELGIFNIAEGVETQQQVDILKQMNCAVIQGWYIGKSLPADQAKQRLLSEHSDQAKAAPATNTTPSS